MSCVAEIKRHIDQPKTDMAEKYNAGVNRTSLSFAGFPNGSQYQLCLTNGSYTSIMAGVIDRYRRQ